jgi:hypothetical protein
LAWRSAWWFCGTTATTDRTAHIAFEDLPAFLAGDAFPDDQSLWHNPFWLTVHDDTIAAIEEQYIP